MKKYYFITILFIFSSFTIIAQYNYYSTDSTSIIGIKLVYGGDAMNSKICQLENGKSVIKFTPYQLKSYGFKDGREYFSREIKIADSTSKVFLERLLTGKTNLYYYKARKYKSFFIEKDSLTLIEIRKQKGFNKSTYKDELLKQTHDCEKVENAIKMSKYSKKSMVKVINRYNDCIEKPFPYFKFGISSGYGLNMLIPKASGNDYDFLESFDYQFEGGLLYGVFIDCPIFLSDFSFHLEFNFSKNAFSYNQLVDNMDLDFVSNISYLNIPVLIRYALPYNKLRPFINAGVCINFNYNNNTKIYETTMGQSVIEINDVSVNQSIDNAQIGYSVGLGIEKKLRFRNSVFVEIRHNYLTGNSYESSFIKSEFQVITGINF